MKYFTSFYADSKKQKNKRFTFETKPAEIYKPLDWAEKKGLKVRAAFTQIELDNGKKVSRRMNINRSHSEIKKDFKRLFKK